MQLRSVILGALNIAQTVKSAANYTKLQRRIHIKRLNARDNYKLCNEGQVIPKLDFAVTMG